MHYSIRRRNWRGKADEIRSDSICTLAGFVRHLRQNRKLGSFVIVLAMLAR